METINLKSALTFRVVFEDERVASFTTKAFRGERVGRGTIPEPKELVPFSIWEIAIDSIASPWFRLPKPVLMTVLWSNVLAVQGEG